MQAAQDIVSCGGGQMCSPFHSFIHNMYVIGLLGITTSKLTHQMNLEMLYMYIGNVLKYSGYNNLSTIMCTGISS